MAKRRNPHCNQTRKLTISFVSVVMFTEQNAPHEYYSTVQMQLFAETAKHHKSPHALSHKRYRTDFRFTLTRICSGVCFPGCFQHSTTHYVNGLTFRIQQRSVCDATAIGHRYRPPRFFLKRSGKFQQAGFGFEREYRCPTDSPGSRVATLPPWQQQHLQDFQSREKPLISASGIRPFCDCTSIFFPNQRRYNHHRTSYDPTISLTAPSVKTPLRFQASDTCTRALTYRHSGNRIGSISTISHCDRSPGNCIDHPTPAILCQKAL